MPKAAQKKPVAKKAAPKKSAKSKAAAKPKPAPNPAKAKPAAVQDIIAAQPGTQIRVAHDQLTPSPLNPRKTFDADKIAEIGASIAEKGLLQPLTVRPRKKGGYEIVIGETRWRAIGAQIESGTLPDAYLIDIIVKELTDKEVIEIGLIENLQRKNLTALEEARGFAALRDAGDTTEQIAARTGIARRTVQSRLTIIDKCARETLKALEAGEITPTQARTLAMATHKHQKELLFSIKDGMYGTEEALLGAVTADYPPTDIAFFPLDRYVGEIITDEGSGRTYFADEAQYLHLQEVGITEKKAAWEEKGVKVVVLRQDKNQWFQSWEWKRKPKDKNAVTVMEITRALEVKVHTGMVNTQAEEDGDTADDDQHDLEDAIARNGGAKTNGDDAADAKATDAFTAAHRAHANRRKTAALQNALADSPAMAVRLVCARILEQYAFGMLTIEPGRNMTAVTGRVSERVVQRLDILLADFPAETRGMQLASHIAADIEEEDTGRAVWRNLCAMDDEQVGALFAALIAARTGIWGDGLGMDDVEKDIAVSLGVAGAEAARGLALGAAPHGPADLEGARKPTLIAIRRALGAEESGKDGIGAISDAIMGMDRGGYVLPTFAFLTREETHAQVTALLTGKAEA